MTLTFPRQILNDRLAECTIDLDPGTEQAVHSRGRRATVSRVREPVWFGTFETPQLMDGDRIAWQSWGKSLRGGLRTFLAWDASRDLPLAYMSDGQMPDDGGSPWDGVATVSSLATPGQIDLTGVPAGYQATAGDRIGLEQEISSRDRYGYFEIMEDATADGSGNLSVTVEPLVPSMFTTAAVAKLYRPLCEFRLVKDSFSAPSRVGYPAVSFQGVQVL
ncbi:hypothetical protein [Oricola thermophila]|uniref:Uncharacterized protein n=1 Tax=Oricola thermophila TaxID=2742145 RepID=A0A6N1VFE2_9HYPH|nr:hypothetical protein [Oricola thermophila]QKV17859.1 hypothetical protein HTY61_04990 [Oricola thermophila]